MNTYEIKKCCRCEITKTRYDFYVRDKELNTRDSFCKECRRKMNLARYWKKKKMIRGV